MVSRLGFLISFGLVVTSAYSSPSSNMTSMDKRYNRTLKAVLEILWKGFVTDIQNKSNVLIFAIPSAVDINFIIQVLDKETKEQVRQSFSLYEKFDIDLKTAAGHQTPNEMLFKTIYYGELEKMNKRILTRSNYSSLSNSSDRFHQLIVSNKDDLPSKWQRLSSAVKESKMGVTCGVMHCAYPIIVTKNAPFAILTLATWNIRSIVGFEWIESATYAPSETLSMRVEAARSVKEVEYAQFKYSTLEGCTGRVLRLPYKPDFNLIFVIPSAKKKCISSEDLWKNVQDVNLNGLKYRRRTMFVSIPLFKVSANIDLKMKLKGNVLARAFDQQSSRLYNTMAFQAAEVIFNPQVPKGGPIPMISGDTPSFWVKSPFFLVLYHAMSRPPIFAGLVNNPGCVSQCKGIRELI